MNSSSTPFVFKCPVRNLYALCVIDNQGRYYASPGWAIGGTYQCTDEGGSSLVHLTTSPNNATRFLYYTMIEALTSGEQFPPTPLPGRDYPEDFHWHDMWMPLGWHDGYADRVITDEQYAKWTEGCDVLFGSTGTHALVVRAAKARHRKRLTMKRHKRRSRQGAANIDPQETLEGVEA